MSITRAEVCAAALADLFLDDGEIMASPMGLLPTVGARRATLPHSPDRLVTDDRVLVVDAEEEDQIKRLTARDGSIANHMAQVRPAPSRT